MLKKVQDGKNERYYENKLIIVALVLCSIIAALVYLGLSFYETKGI